MSRRAGPPQPRALPDASLLPFFQPTSVVVIGVSTNPAKPGYGAARNLAESGFRGEIHFVSQKAGQLFGRPVHASLKDVPGQPDLAVLLVPAASALPALEDCAERGIRAVIVLSGGFRELGGEGAAREARLVQYAREQGIRLVGPNCVGLVDTYLPLDTSFLPPPLPPAGPVAVVSQSGAMLAILIDWARGEQVGFSRLLSLGNKADVDEADVLALAVAQEETRLLVMYIESLSDGARFLEQARRVSARLPVLALKVGRGEAGKLAAASHTGALAGSDAAYQAAFERAGILRARTSEQLLDWILAFTRCPLPRGRQVAVLTNAGGPGVLAADAVEAEQLRLAELAPATVEKLADFLSPAASLHNPLDMLAAASPEDYARSLELLLEDPAVQAAAVLLPAPPMFPPEQVVAALVPVIRRASKPVVVNLFGQARLGPALELMRREGLAAYPTPERAVAALAGLAARAELEQPAPAEPAELPGIDRSTARACCAGGQKGEWLAPAAVETLLSAYGIPVAPLRLARSASEARDIATSLGFPLAVKLASPDIPHKSDVGGVLLGVANPDEAARAFETVMERARIARPAARLEGAFLQRMLPPGQEVILGAVRDEVFGPLMMFGSGGVEVEGLKDVAFDLAPLTQEQAGRLIERTWAGRKLSGFRSLPAGDLPAVREVLVRLACLACDLPQIGELEINPLRVLAPGQGALAVDARVRLRE